MIEKKCGTGANFMKFMNIFDETVIFFTIRIIRRDQQTILTGNSVFDQKTLRLYRTIQMHGSRSKGFRQVVQIN